MPHIDESNTSCRFWGYSPRSYEYVDGKQLGDTTIRKADAKKIKEAGFRASNYGYPNKSSAVRVATDIEKASGVDMYVFRHDYM